MPRRRGLALAVLALLSAAADPARPAGELFDRFRTTPGNLAFSPASVTAAVAMAAEGAGGATRRQMTDFLGGEPGDGPAADAGFAHAASVWLQAGFDPEPAFVERLRERHRASAHVADFANAPEPARQALNRWVARHTNDRVRDLVPPGGVSAETRLALVSAAAFKGRWAAPFDPKRTADAPFALGPGRSAVVPMMAADQPARHLKADRFAAAELPLDAGTLVLVVPAELDGLKAAEAELAGGGWGRLFARLAAAEPAVVNVSLPRFRVGWDAPLKAALTAAGVTDAFDAQRADFGGVNGRGNLHLTAALHRAVVEVNEEGVEAAAGTALAAGGKGVKKVEVPSLRADRPFLFAVRGAGGAVLFLGRVADPSR